MRSNDNYARQKDEEKVWQGDKRDEVATTITTHLERIRFGIQIRIRLASCPWVQ